MEGPRLDFLIGEYALIGVLVLVFAIIAGVLAAGGICLRFEDAAARWIGQRFVIQGRLPEFDAEPCEFAIDGGSWRTNKLCTLCQDTLNASWLLRGSPLGVSRTQEELRFHDSMDSLASAAETGCHLCSLLRYSMDSPTRQQSITTSSGWTRGSTDESLSSVATDEETGLLPTSVVPQKRISLNIFREVVRRKSAKADASTYIQLKQGGQLLGKRLVVREERTPISRTVDASTGSDNTIKQIQRWINTCQRDHSACGASEPSSLPTRLIFVGNETEPGALRLIQNGDKSPLVQYLALSHCWGGAQITTLTKENYDDFTEQIDIDTLPRNFRDAIHVARRLKISYIWIDSLCIIQDSPEDWLKESQQMYVIFSNATCTIASTASRTPFGGCFRNRNPLGRLPLHLTRGQSSSDGDDESALCVDLSSADRERRIQEDVEQSPLNQRGWAFQERSLSTRIVHFAENAVIFECDMLYASDLDEARPQLARQTTYRRQRDVDDLLSAGQGMMSGRDDGSDGGGSTQALKDSVVRLRLEFNRRWYGMVAAYTSRALTRRTDRLVAFSGVAVKMSQMSELTYVAGLWEENILYNLLWAALGAPRRRPIEYRAPTWSWASIDNPVDHVFSRGRSLVTAGRDFQVDDLLEWSSIGEEGVVAGHGALLGAQEVPSPPSGRYDCFYLELSEVWTVSVSLEPKNAFRCSRGSASGQYFPDIELDLGTHDPEFMLCLLCEHSARFTACHGIVLKRVNEQNLSREDVYERVGCFRLDGSDMDNVFQYGTKRAIIVV